MSFEYYANGKVLRHTKSLGETNTFVYNDFRRESRTINERGDTRVFFFDKNGNAERIVLEDGGEFNYVYGNSDRTFKHTRETSPIGFSTSYEYDAAGNVVRITDPDGYSVAFLYDSMHRPVRAYDEEGKAISHSLDLGGKPRQVMDANGAATTYEYYDSSQNGRLAKVTDAGGRWTRTTYDENGNVVTVTDSAGRSTLTTYDELDRPTRVVGPAYDDITHGRIRPVTLSTWDALGNLVRVSTVRNALGQVTTAQSPEVTYSHSYDAAHRLAAVTDSRGNKTLRYARSPGGRLNRLTVSDSGSVDYRYDAVGRLTTIWDSQDSYLAFVYDQGARLKQKWLANGITTDYAHNADNSVAQIRNSVYDFGTGKYETLTRHDLSYDALGRRRTASERVGPFTAPAQTVGIVKLILLFQVLFCYSGLTIPIVFKYYTLYFSLMLLLYIAKIFKLPIKEPVLVFSLLVLVFLLVPLLFKRLKFRTLWG